MLVFISYFTCCVSAWPILNQRRTYSYEPALEDAYFDLPIASQWALAEQPEPVYDTMQTIPLQQQQQQLYLDYENPIYDQVRESFTK